MRTALTAQQIVYYRQEGHIRFDNLPLETLEPSLSRSTEKRDLWRRDPILQKFIANMLAPIVLELTKRKSLRLVCDQFFEETPAPGRMQDLFCFQGLAAICVLKEALDIYEPSAITALIAPQSYVIVFGADNARYIENKKDPYYLQPRKYGYNYGDLLSTEQNPAFFPR